MVELIFFIFQIVKFYKIVNYSKLVNYLENWLIFQIGNFWVGCKITNAQMQNDRGFGILKLRILK